MGTSVAEQLYLFSTLDGRGIFAAETQYFDAQCDLSRGFVVKTFFIARWFHFRKQNLL